MDYALFIIGFLWAFWAMYVLVMGIYRAHLAKRMTPVTLALSLPFVALGYVMDVLANITVASAVFVEPPREMLVTDRLKRHINHGTGWRKALASLKMRSSQVTSAPSAADYNRLQADVAAIYAALVQISNILDTARIPKV